jgi:hypothetical protein
VSVAVRPAPVKRLQELLVLALELVVDDDAPHCCAPLAELAGSSKVGTVDLGVVGELLRLSEAGIELLARILAIAPPGRTGAL